MTIKKTHPVNYLTDTLKQRASGYLPVNGANITFPSHLKVDKVTDAEYIV